MPDFLRMPAIGLDISDHAVKYVVLKNTNKGLAVEAFGRRDLEEGIIKHGVIQDEKKLIVILNEVQKETGLHFARVAIPEMLVYGFNVNIPKVNHDQIKQAIEFQIEDHVPIQKESLIFDYEILSEGSRSYFIKVNAILKKTFESYNEALINSGLSVASFEPEPESVFRAIRLKDGQKNAIVIDLGSRRTSLSIVGGEKIISSSTVDFSGNLLANIIAGDGSSFEEFEKAKKGMILGDDEKSEKIKKQIDILNIEIKKHFNYWKEHLDIEDSLPSEDTSVEVFNGKEGSVLDIEKSGMIPVILSGGSAHLSGLPEYMSKKLKTNVSFADIWTQKSDSKSGGKNILKDGLLIYATAIGLALSDFNYD